MIITQGADSTVVVQAQSSTDVTTETYNVNKIDPSKIVDTNGAGDAFAGGFLGTLAQGKSIEQAIQGGHWLATESISLMGPNVCDSHNLFFHANKKVPDAKEDLQSVDQFINLSTRRLQRYYKS